MKVSPPKPGVWWICLICLLLGVLIELNVVAFPKFPFLQQFKFWIVAGGLGLLLIANRTSGL